MLAAEPVGYCVDGFFVEEGESPFGVVFGRRCENDDLVEFLHKSQKTLSGGSETHDTFSIVVVNQSLVQIQNQSVQFSRFIARQKRLYGLDRLKVCGLMFHIFLHRTVFVFLSARRCRLHRLCHQRRLSITNV
mgnify:CR=1 FL=1